MKLTLTYHNQIIALMKLKTEDSRKAILTKYAKSVIESGKLLCYKCRFPINIGDDYCHSSHGRIRKTYHSDCFERLWQ